MLRLALTALFVSLFATTAHAQISGGLEGKWQRYTVVVEGDGGADKPAFDVWIDGDLIAWRARAALRSTDLDRALIWQPGEVVSTPPADARVSTSVERPAAKPTLSSPAHLLVEDGVVSGLVELRLEPGCSKACDLAGIDVVELDGRRFAPSRGPSRTALRLPASGAFPIEPGDVQRSWR